MSCCQRFRLENCTLTNYPPIRKASSSNRPYAATAACQRHPPKVQQHQMTEPHKATARSATKWNGQVFKPRQLLLSTPQTMM